MKGDRTRKWSAEIVVENSAFRGNDMGQDVHCSYLAPGAMPI